MRVLCTFPGRHGDLLWALPTIRAISRRLGTPVDLQIAGEFAALVPLLAQQPYLGHVWPDPDWAPHPDQRQPPARQPLAGGGIYDATVHLGYRGWPEPDVVRHTLATLNRAPIDAYTEAELALDEPWITVAPWTQVPHDLVIGWSETYFELKYGLTHLIKPRGARSAFVLCAPGSRWNTESGAVATDWIENARRLAAARVFLGCCSALHVLAVAIGIPVVLMEPMAARWNPIFYPLGTDGRVRLVRGLDGQPTWDARHVQQTIEEVLHASVP